MEIEKITIEELQAKAKRLRPEHNLTYDWLYKALTELQVGEAIAFQHTCNRKRGSGRSSSCTIATQTREFRRKKRPEVSLRTHHLKDGRFGVACYAKEESDA